MLVSEQHIDSIMHGATIKIKVVYKISKIVTHFTYWEFANFAYLELTNIQGLRCIVFHFHQETVNIFNIADCLSVTSNPSAVRRHGLNLFLQTV